MTKVSLDDALARYDSSATPGREARARSSGASGMEARQAVGPGVGDQEGRPGAKNNGFQSPFAAASTQARPAARCKVLFVSEGVTGTATSPTCPTRAY